MVAGPVKRRGAVSVDDIRIQSVFEKIFEIFPVCFFSHADYSRHVLAIGLGSEEDGPNEQEFSSAWCHDYCSSSDVGALNRNRARTTTQLIYVEPKLGHQAQVQVRHGRLVRVMDMFTTL